MKHLYVWIVAGMAAVAAIAQDGTFPMGAPVGVPTGGTPLEHTLAAVTTILTLVVTILGAVAKIKWSAASQSGAVLETVIKGIETAPNPGNVKANVKAIAAEEGQTVFLNKKVQKVAEEVKDAAAAPTPTVGDPAPTPPASGPDTQRTTGG